MKPNLAIGIDVDGSFFGGKDDFESSLATPGFPDPSVSFDLIGGNAHAKYAFATEGSKMAPWLTGGLGMYNVKSKLEDSAADFDDSETDFGFYLGGGIDWKSSPTMSPGIDARWYNVSTEDNSTSYFTIGLHLTFSTTGTTQ
jgi:opacity protein-like surface antigen